MWEASAVIGQVASRLRVKEILETLTVRLSQDKLGVLELLKEKGVRNDVLNVWEPKSSKGGQCD